MDNVIGFFGRIYIPSAVFEETLQKQDMASKEVQSLINGGKIKVLKCEKYFIFSTKIHKGELEAINLTKQLNGMVVLDDLVARKVARSEGIPLIGTLGILRVLIRLNIIQIDTNELFDKLIKAGFRITKRLFYRIMVP